MRSEDLQIDAEEVLGYLGVTGIEWRGRELHYECPFPGHKSGSSNNNASFRESDRHPWWMGHCYVCGWSGDLCDFFSQAQGLGKFGRNRAKKWFRDQYGIGSWSDERYAGLAGKVNKMLNVRDVEERKVIPALPEEILEERAVDWFAAWDAYQQDPDSEELEPFFYMFKRGFTPETLEAWEIAYDPISEMVAIPYRDAEGRLIGLKGRAWWSNARPKYRFLGNKGNEDRYGFDTIEISQVLYGIWRLKPGKRVIMCEGELNSIAMDQHGYDRVLGLSGQYLSPDQARYLKWIADEVWFIFDEDEKAVQAARALHGVSRVPSYIIPERDSDPADATTEEVDQWFETAVPSLYLS